MSAISTRTTPPIGINGSAIFSSNLGIEDRHHLADDRQPPQLDQQQQVFLIGGVADGHDGGFVENSVVVPGESGKASRGKGMQK